MTTPPHGASVVTITADYGAAGSLIGPALAAKLGLAFIDRMVPLQDVASIEKRNEQLSTQEREQRPASRLVSSMVRASAVLGAPSHAIADVPTAADTRRELLTSLTAATVDGGVVLGRAGAFVLRGFRGAFHVRLSGPEERRIVRAMMLEGVDQATATKHLRDADRVRRQVVKRTFDRDVRDPSLYHLVLDTTVLSLDDSVEVLAAAAVAFWRATPAQPASS
jgi:cytidylate kinase